MDVFLQHKFTRLVAETVAVAGRAAEISTAGIVADEQVAAVEEFSGNCPRLVAVALATGVESAGAYILVAAVGLAEVNGNGVARPVAVTAVWLAHYHDPIGCFVAVEVVAEGLPDLSRVDGGDGFGRATVDGLLSG